MWDSIETSKSASSYTRNSCFRSCSRCRRPKYYAIVPSHETGRARNSVSCSATIILPLFLAALLHIADVVDDQHDNRFSTRLSFKSRFPTSSSCTSRLHGLKYTGRSSWRISSCPNAHSKCVFPAPLLPNASTFSRRSRKFPSSNVRSCRATFAGIEPHIRHRTGDHGSHLGRIRWVVERTISWIKGLRRMRVRYDRSGTSLDAWTSIAATVVCLNILREAGT